jgi:hypothetical protein
MRISIFIFFLVASAFTSGAEKIDPYVSSIVSLGEWKKSDKRGFIRFVTKQYGSEHIACRLWIQWISYHIDGISDSEIIATREVTELSEFPVSFDAPKCKGGWPCEGFLLSATNSFSNNDYKFYITIGSVGEYEIEKVIP